jgi:hypothetical protein
MMKRFVQFALCLGAIAASASAAQITLVASFSSSDPLAVYDINGAGDTIVEFLISSYALSCTGPDAGSCGGNATLSGTTLDASLAHVISLGGDLEYVMDPGWSVVTTGSTAVINTTGTFRRPSDIPGTSTPGVFVFSMPLVLDNCSGLPVGCSNFSAQGISYPVPDVPEPATTALMMSGLGGVAVLALRRRPK